jgi:hypothetical protein
MVSEETHVKMRTMSTIRKTEGATIAIMIVLPSFAEAPTSLAIRMRKIKVKMIVKVQLNIKIFGLIQLLVKAHVARSNLRD